MSVQVSHSDFCTAAKTLDGSLVVDYFPTVCTVTVNMTVFRAPANAGWFNPTDGSIGRAPAALEELEGESIYRMVRLAEYDSGAYQDPQLCVPTNPTAPRSRRGNEPGAESARPSGSAVDFGWDTECST